MICAKEPELFRVSALSQLEDIAGHAKLIRQELGSTTNVMGEIATTTNEIFKFVKNMEPRPHPINQKAIAQLLENPHVCHLEGLMELNALLLTDEPSRVVAGRLRCGR